MTVTEPLSVITGTFAHANAIKTRSTFQLIIEIPIEGADAALSRLGGWPQPGKEKAVAVALLNTNRTLAAGPDAFDQPARLNLKAKDPATLAQLSGILRNNERFWQFLDEKYPHIPPLTGGIPDRETKQWATEKLHEITGVESCKEFDTDNRAAHRFLMLKEAFDAWSA
jgi:hypothetical protein